MQIYSYFFLFILIISYFIRVLLLNIHFHIESSNDNDNHPQILENLVYHPIIRIYNNVVPFGNYQTIILHLYYQFIQNESYDLL